MTDLKGRRIAVLATDGVEQVELTEPVKALRAAGAEVEVVSPKGGAIQGMKFSDPGDKLKVDTELKQARADSFNGLVLPGGVANPDTLRTIPEAVKFVQSFVDANKPIGAICHGSWTLIDAGGVKGKKVTSWPSLKQDLLNAGASWIDEPVVRDGGLVTSRMPDDLPQFTHVLIELFAA
jgi:protease I